MSKKEPAPSAPGEPSIVYLERLVLEVREQLKRVEEKLRKVERKIVEGGHE